MTNPYEGIPLDLSEATFDKPQLDQQAIDSLVARLNEITASNLSTRAQWTSLLQSVDNALTMAGLALRVASVT